EFSVSRFHFTANPMSAPPIDSSPRNSASRDLMDWPRNICGGLFHKCPNQRITNSESHRRDGNFGDIDLAPDDRHEREAGKDVAGWIHQRVGHESDRNDQNHPDDSGGCAVKKVLNEMNVAKLFDVSRTGDDEYEGWKEYVK